ncbi:MAG: c-type cytochrome domain-containing protein, partial [Planctomycetaceae bacterium]
MPCQRLLFLATLVVALISGTAHPLPGAEDGGNFFESRIRPVLISSCVGCHGPARASGGLRLDSRAALIRGGDSGPVVDLDEPGASHLLAAISRQADVAAMPPDRNLALRADQVADFSRWIREGLQWPEPSGGPGGRLHWAFEPLRPGERPAPAFNSLPGDATRTWIDDYLDHRLAQGGLTPGPAAPPEVWLRRLAFD